MTAAGTTIDAWLAARSTDVPPQLAAAVRSALGDDVAQPDAEAPERCIAAAEGIVNELLGAGSTDRGSAVALLTADALATYAFEAAAADPQRLAERAAAAMRTLAGPP